jgi:hypothetical protein
MFRSPDGRPCKSALRLIVSENQDATEALRLLLHVNKRDRQAIIVNEAFARAWIDVLKRELDSQRMADL